MCALYVYKEKKSSVVNALTTLTAVVSPWEVNGLLRIVSIPRRFPKATSVRNRSPIIINFSALHLRE